MEKKITLNGKEWSLMLEAFVEYYGKAEGEEAAIYDTLYDRFAQEANFFDEEPIETEYTIIY
jgi:hypothetical protein